MRRVILALCVVTLSVTSGCTVSDALFCVFGEAYTGGGYTQADKKYHYDRQVEASRHYSPDAPWTP